MSTLRYLTVLALALAPMPLAAQGTIAGRIVDSGTGRPIASAYVVLRSLDGHVLVRDGVVVPERAAETGADGAYRFDALAPGRYELHVRSVGYRDATVQVNMMRPAEAAVSIALVLQPFRLVPFEIRIEDRAPLFLRASYREDELDDARIRNERARQERFIAPDARVLTWADMQDGVTLGERDVFRALHRFPGVGTRDDYTAELWTRGAPWTHTATTFDGVPLFNPLHAIGVLSAIAPDVLGAVYFHPGVRPASVAGGAAGVVDLRSRPALGDGAIGGALDLSMAGIGATAEQRIGDRTGWIASARRSHLDFWADGVDAFGVNDVDLPYVFEDVTARADVPLGGRARAEASGLWERDRIFGDLDAVLERTEARWGNTAGRVTLHTGIGGFDVAHSLRASRFDAHTDERRIRTRPGTQDWHEPAADNTIDFLQLAGELKPAGDDIATWSLGWDVARQRLHYDGPLPRYHAVKPDTAGRLLYARELTLASAWAELRHTAGRFTFEPGLRVDAGEELADAPAVRLAPRVAVRYALSPDHTVAVAAGRTWQYTQAIGLAGPSIHPAFHASHFWIWADDRIPPIRSDIASLGTERWVGSWLLSANAYVRRAAGVAAPDPAPGDLLRRPVAISAENRARGLEIGIRRIGTSWSASLGYSIAKSELVSDSLRYPSPADRRHVIDAMAAVRLPAGFRLSTAYTGMSGAPFTRAVSRRPDDCELFGFGCSDQNARIQAPNAERTRAYHSLDASLHWGRRFGNVSLSAYVQLRNALGRANDVTYSGSVAHAIRTRGGRTEIVWDDLFEPGLPRMPLLGLRVEF